MIACRTVDLHEFIPIEACVEQLPAVACCLHSVDSFLLEKTMRWLNSFRYQWGLFFLEKTEHDASDVTACGCLMYIHITYILLHAQSQRRKKHKYRGKLIKSEERRKSWRLQMKTAIANYFQPCCWQTTHQWSRQRCGMSLELLVLSLLRIGIIMMIIFITC